MKKTKTNKFSSESLFRDADKSSALILERKERKKEKNEKKKGRKEMNRNEKRRDRSESRKTGRKGWRKIKKNGKWIFARHCLLAAIFNNSMIISRRILQFWTNMSFWLSCAFTLPFFFLLLPSSWKQHKLKLKDNETKRKQEKNIKNKSNKI